MSATPVGMASGAAASAAPASAAKPSPAPGVPSVPRRAITTAEEAIELIKQLEYQAFDTRSFRKGLVAAKWTPSDVLRALTIYVSCGNNPWSQRRQSRARDVDSYKMEIQWLASKNIGMRVNLREDISLARIAKCYAPALLALRRAALDVLPEPQVETTTEKAKCDIAFLGMGDTVLLRGCDNYVEQFGMLISKAGKPTATEDELKARNKSIKAAALRGLESDALLKRELSKDTSDLMEAIVLLHVA
jgi:hypothetical protein